MKQTRMKRALIVLAVIMFVLTGFVTEVASASPAPAQQQSAQQSAKITYTFGRMWEHSYYQGRILQNMQGPSRCEVGAGWLFQVNSIPQLIGVSSVEVYPGNGSHCNFITVTNYSGVSWGICVTYALRGYNNFGADFNDRIGYVRLQRSDVCANQLGYWYN